VIPIAKEADRHAHGVPCLLSQLADHQIKEIHVMSFRRMLLLNFARCPVHFLFVRHRQRRQRRQKR